MTIVNYIQESKKQFISYEIIPPKRGVELGTYKPLVEELAMVYGPPFIDVTSHGEHLVKKEGWFATLLQKWLDIHLQSPERTRDGTLGICRMIEQEYQTMSVPHVVCHGFDKEETEQLLRRLQEYNIKNILAIYGDDKGYNRANERNGGRNQHAIDLVHQIKEFDPGFCVGVAAYPEKHYQEPNMESGIEHLLEKQEAGADYAVTQMFFDNKDYRQYIRECRDMGVTIPILPGIKLLATKGQLTSLPAAFHCDIPYDLSRKIENAETPEKVWDIGAEWARNQIVDLFENGIRLKNDTTEHVPGVHLYIMQSIAPVHRLMDKMPAKFDLRRENPR